MKKESKPNILQPVPGNEVELKQEFLNWLISIICALVTYCGVAQVILHAYTPDVAALKAAGAELLIAGDSVRPEPMEAMLFRVAVVLIPLLLTGFYYLFSKKGFLRPLAEERTFTIVSVLSVLAVGAMVYLDLAAPNPFFKDGGDIPQIGRDYFCDTNYSFYFGGHLPENGVLLYTFVIMPLISCLFFIGFKKYRWDEGRLFRQWSLIATYCMVGAVIACCVAMSVFYFPYQSENKFDFNAVYYSMTQVYAGQPLLTGHFVNTYGLYPHFLNPVFQLTGLSIVKFSFVMSLLIGASFILNFYCLRQFVTNNVILCLGMLTVVFFPFLDFKFGETFDANFAVYPIRYIIPSILLFFSVSYFRTRQRRKYWLFTAVLASLVLWNPEFGIVSYISWIVFNTYIDLYDDNGAFAYKKMALHWVYFAVILVVVFTVYKLMIYLFYGQVPDMSLLWSSVIVFGKLSFNMLPMTLIHPWNIVALILILGTIYAISKWFKKVVTAESAMILLLSVVGVGFFFYFQGRSHNWQLAQSSGMALMLLTILGDKLWRKVKDSKLVSLNVFFVLFMYVISFSFVVLLFNPGVMRELITQEADKEEDKIGQFMLESGREFIVNSSDEYQKIYVLTLRKFQGLHFDGTKRASAFNPGMVDLAFKDDVVRMEKQLRDSSFSVYITPETFYGMTFMERPFAAMAATYQLKTKNNFMSLLTKRRKMIPGKTFFEQGREHIVHRKYTDDLAGVQMRVEDAFGTKKLDLKDTFSVEILFDSEDQIFPSATLLGNQDDSVSGFAISQILNSPKYAFIFNDKGFTLTIPQNGWVYCAVNVFPDHFEVYFNGSRARSHPLAKPMQPSDTKLCIGNLGYMHNYIGAIAEVAINNHALDTANINETWGVVKKEFRSR